MTLRHSIFAVAVTTFVLGMALPAQAQSGALSARTSDANGVRIVVKPKPVAAGAAWEFDVTMDTHTTPLDADLTKAAVLLDDNQQRYAATAWTGDPPGGHHRKGVLRFPAPAGKITSFEVQMEEVGGSAKRVFRWAAK